MHLNCPHCHNPVELVKLTDEEIVCPSCGSTFRVEDDALLAETRSLDANDKLQLFGRFELRGAVGSGAFGTVYRAYDPQLDRTVALKVPRPGNLGEGQARALFLREARSAARLRHPAIVTVHEVGEHDGAVFLVSDFIEGYTLADLLTSRRLALREAAELVAQAAEALHFAHGLGVVHRDIKPSNIMIGADGRPIVMDFGLAKRDAGEVTMTLSGQVLGTPAYMPPEQARGEGHQVDGRADVYSLGVVLYQLTTGEQPFRGNSRMLLHQVLNDDPRAPRKLNDRIPRDLETITLKAMAKEPTKRYATALALAADLRRFLRDEPIMARPVGRLEQAARWSRRNPVLAATSGLAATALIAIAVISTAFAIERTRLAGRILKEQGKTSQALGRARTEREDARRERDKARHLAATLAFREGVQAGEQDDAGAVLLWMVRGLTLAPEGDIAIRHSMLSNLSAWRIHCNSVRQIIPSQGIATAVAFSPDGKRLLIGSVARTQLWDAADGKPIGRPMTHRVLRVMAVAFSPDGKTVLSGSEDKTARLWDAADGAPAGRPMTHQGQVISVAFSPDGKTFLTGSADGSARLWDAPDGEPLGRPMTHQGPVSIAVFSPDGKRVLTGSFDRTARLWNAPDGTPIGRPMTHQLRVSSVAFSPDGNRILTGSNDGTARLWDAADGAPAGRPMTHAGPVISVAFGIDGKSVLTGSFDGTVRLFTVADGGDIGRLMTHPGPVSSVAFSPDGKCVLTGSKDNTARLWDAANGTPIGRPMVHDGVITDVAFDPDGKRVLTGSEDKTARLWDAAGTPAGRPMTHQVEVWAVAFSPDGKRVLTGSADGTARLWDAVDGKPIGRPISNLSPVTSVAFSPDGNTVLTGGWGREPVAFSPNRLSGPTGSRDHARLWNAVDGKPIGRPMSHQPRVNSVAFSPDGKRVLTGGDDGAARIWDVSDNKPIGRPVTHQGRVMAVAFSPDGMSILTGGEDKTARLWGAADGTPIGRPMTHDGSVSSVAFSPDGKSVLTGSDDGTARLWPMPMPMRGDLRRIEVWAQVISGMEIGPDEVVRALDEPTWRALREQLDALGGPPGP